MTLRGERVSGTLLSFVPICLQPSQHVGHARHRARVGIEQWAADELDVIGVDRHVIGDTIEPGSFHGDAAVAFAVGQLVEHFGQIGRGSLGQAAENAGVPGDEIKTPFDLLLVPRAVKKPRSPARM